MLKLISLFNYFLNSSILCFIFSKLSFFATNVFFELSIQIFTRFFNYLCIFPYIINMGKDSYLLLNIKQTY